MDTEKDQINIREKLIALQNRLYDISKRNPFVDIKKEKLWFQPKSNIDNAKAKKIFDKQNYFLKEYGLETTLLIDLFIQWRLPNKTTFYCSPLLYQAARLKKNQKIELQYTVEVNNSDNWVVNPIVAHLFKRKFDYDFDDYYTSIDSVIHGLKEHFDSENNKINVLNDFTLNEEWQIIKQSAIGTFNYHKSILAKDFESIIVSPNGAIKKLFGFENNQTLPPVFDLLGWFPLDISQKKVVATAASNSIVVQGPPGTGKSHTIVTLLQHYLFQGKKVLFVSEKKSALDVVYKRLGILKTSAAYFDVEKQDKLSFYKSLKRAFEATQINKGKLPKQANDLALLKNRIYPRIARQKELDKNVSISDLENELIKSSAQVKKPSLNSVIPDYKLWNEHLVELIRIEKLGQQEWQVDTIGESLFLNLNSAVFREREPIVKINKKIDELLTNVELVQHIQSNYHLDLDWEEFSKMCLSASILNMVNRSQIDLLFEDTKAYKSFNTWSKKYQLTKHQFDAIKVKNLSWRKRPPIDAIEAHQFLTERKGLFSKFKLKRSHQNLFKNYVQDVPVSKGREILKRLLIEFELSEKLEELKIKLKHNLNILNPDSDIDFILNIRKKIESVSHNYYQSILEHNEHEELVHLLADQHKIISNINRVKSYLFKNRVPQKIGQLIVYLRKLRAELTHIHSFVPEIKSVLSFPSSILNFIVYNHLKINELSMIVAKNDLDHSLKYHDYLKHLTGRQLLRDLEDFNEIKNKTYLELLEAIQHRQAKDWQDLESLSITPNSKLNLEAKKKKNHFKQAKKLMVHEMNKKRQLLPIKDLFKSCEKELTTLLPIWILNPLAIAERLPLNPEIFDIVIFDESSQIPLEDALPAIYRSKQMVVVGDSQQMPPNLFFSSSQQDTTTLLNEAEKTLPNQPLLWHYRSEHPDLISFSNQNFYDNELKLFPATSNYKAIEYHYIANGIFSNSINEFEAIAIAQRYKELLAQQINDIGIIAFSKEQEKCIRKKVIELGLPIQNSTVIKNLESIQGIEKEHILISIGYAKNEDGKLNRNFGPINHEQGSNRLNVLFSRATKKMEIYASIKSSEIGLSDNRGLSLLSQFLSFGNNKEKIASLYHDSLSKKIAGFFITKGYDLVYTSEYSGYIINNFVDYSTQKILLVNPGLYSEDDLDVAVIVSLLKKRFKQVRIVLNNDWIIDSDKVLKELESYFKS